MNNLDLNCTLVIDTKDEQIRWILSQMIFTTGPVAHRLRLLGYDIQCRAEAEQLATMVWMILMYQKHGKDWRQVADKILREAVKPKCFVHEDRMATKFANLPCAPGGGLWVCDECETDDGKKVLFQKYKAGHGKEITAFKQTNPGS